MTGGVTLCVWEKPVSSDYNLMKIVKFLGGSVKTVELSGQIRNPGEYLRSAGGENPRLAISARTLQNLQRASRQSLREIAQGLARNVFVFDFGPNENGLIKELAQEKRLGVAAIESGGTIQITDKAPNICRQFSGLSFERARTSAQRVFDGWNDTPDARRLLSFRNQPFFGVLEGSVARWMVLASDGIANLDEGVSRGCSILEYVPSLIPVMMFQKGTSKEEFWHNPAPEACFIVDDPLLKERYGFLEYKRLLEQMEQRRFSTSIAFIPWNYSRSDRRVAELFAAHSPSLSLCVHGCDHTRGEFGATDSDLLAEKARKAERRMRLHRKLSGVDFDPVMVFPQGIFSTAAMRALKSRGYLAAVNTTAYPVDAPAFITLRDLLQPAVTQFSGFPLFTRRYPQYLAEVAFDLFVGKPALLVEHHGYFRHGYEALGGTVEALNRLDSRLRWSNLGSVCSRACLRKVNSNGEIFLKFFTSRFSFRNDTSEGKRYVLIGAAWSLSEVKKVLVNGEPVAVSGGSEGVQFAVSLDPGQSGEVRIVAHRQSGKTRSFGHDRVYEARVFMRRSLCELRDNYLDRSLLLSRSARKSAGGRTTHPISKI